MTTTATTFRRSQEDRRAHSERALIDAAAQLIAEGGSAAVTLAKVGERAGFSRGLANHHFGTKANLMARVIHDVTDTFQASLNSAPNNGTVKHNLQYLITIYMNVVQNPQPINRARLVLFGEAITESFAYQNVIQECDRLFRTSLEEAFQRGIESGEMQPGLDSSSLAIITIGLLRGIACQAFTQPELNTQGARRESEKLLLTQWFT
jgi:AcrR family transcriptional regulator